MFSLKLVNIKTACHTSTACWHCLSTTVFANISKNVLRLKIVIHTCRFFWWEYSSSSTHHSLILYLTVLCPVNFFRSSHHHFNYQRRKRKWLVITSDPWRSGTIYNVLYGISHSHVPAKDNTSRTRKGNLYKCAAPPTHAL